MIKVGIIGGAGYTAGELIRLLLNHPEAEIVFINSSSNAGNKITDVHEGLYGETDLVFTDQLPLEEIDVLFFCTAHGDTKKFLAGIHLGYEHNYVLRSGWVFFWQVKGDVMIKGADLLRAGVGLGVKLPIR